MPGIKRRQFFQFAGSALAALGISHLDIQRQGDRYGRVLAQSTSRKLALLVGINEYPNSDRFDPLDGCVTDVELQRQLLIHRFGFNNKDILSLTNAAASRQGILTAFDEHLIKQAKPGDVVVFHFSGHGSRVKDPNPIHADQLDSTFVPCDAGSGSTEGVVEDIMGYTLFLLMSALKTENVTVVLDSCHSGGGTRGNIRIRAARGGANHKPSAAELAYQEQWLSRLPILRQELEDLRKKGVAKGVVIASAQRDQYAADAPFGDFYAGAFTYLMTQYLWQQTGNPVISSAIANISRSTTQLSDTGQKPLLEVKPNSSNGQKPVYFINIQKPPAEAVITKVEGNRATLWLGGLGPESLEAFQAGALFTIVNTSGGRGGGQVKLESRQGLEGVATLQAAATSGTLLQEAIRTVPTDLKLRIGLDPSLGASADKAQVGLQGVERVLAVRSKPGNVPYEGEVHYILGRMTAELRKQLQQKQVELPVEGSLGLFSQSLELIPGSFGPAGEDVTDAVQQRLKAKFKSLLAARLVKLTLNTSSSRLDVEVSMSPEGKENELIAKKFTPRGSSGEGSPKTKPAQALTTNSQQLPLGTPIQFRITNNEPQHLYVSVLVIDQTGEMSVVFPNYWAAATSATQVEANTTLLVPDPDTDEFVLVTKEPKGFVEVLVLASRSPLDKAIKALQAIAPPGQRGPVTPDEPVDVVGDFLDDLSQGTRGGGSEKAQQPRRAMDTTQMAALSITFEVI